MSFVNNLVYFYEELKLDFMSSKDHSHRNIPVSNILFLFICIFFSSFSNAQCAGEDAQITICDIPNPANQSVNLFTLLGGTPTAGGIWTNLQQATGFNTNTGILNVASVNESDTYVFIYTVNNPSCADNTATVTVTVGGYAGTNNPNASACDENDSVNLFQFVGNFPNPQLNGTWSDDSATGALSGNFLDATISGLGAFQFTYTMPAIGTCPAHSAVVNLTVHPAPEPGITNDLILCDSEDLSQYSNLNLLDYIVGQDPGGDWSESGTSELSSPSDTFINVQNIYNTLGPGSYSFTYKVKPSHPICTEKTSIVLIVIEQQIDFTGSTLVVASDICEDEVGLASFTATLTQGVEAVPNGQYQITYQITGPIPSGNTILANFINGVVTFPIPSISFPLVGAYNVSIENIHETGGYNACQHIIGNIFDLVNVFPLPKINTGTLTINNACEDSDVLVQLSGNTNLTDGNYQITYNLTGSNTATNQVVQITVSGGVSNFIIPFNLLQNPGDTTITITNIINLQTGCENTASLSQTFTLNPVPNGAPIFITISDVCENQPVIVSIGGLGTLTSVQINYQLTGSNSFTNTATLPVNSGTAILTIPSNVLPNTGDTTFILQDIVNSVTFCGLINYGMSNTFTINENPDAPIAGDLQFCISENATVQDLVPNGSEFQWFDSATSTTALSNALPLSTGNYYVSEMSLLGCSSPKTQIFVTVDVIPAPTLEANGQNFCGLNSPAPSIADLSANVNFSGTIIWYDALSGGNQLSDSHILQDGITYYGFDSVVSGCVSQDALAVTVSLLNCDIDEYALLIPDGFSPNGDGINDTFNIPDIEFLFPNFTLEIYNRYGNLLYKGHRNTPDWDGRNNKGAVSDGIAPNGVYFYIVNFNKDNVKSKQGRLYLNR